MHSDLPSGTVTFLFTDVEGSTKLLHELGAEGYADALAEHRRVIRKACAAKGGVEVDTQGDAFFFAFPTAPGAIAAAAALTETLAAGSIAVRLHPLGVESRSVRCLVESSRAHVAVVERLAGFGSEDEVLRLRVP